MKRINEGYEYLLHWKNNPCTWNDSLSSIKKRKDIVKIKGRYYTIVIAHYTGDFFIVDCTCDSKGNYYPIYADLLKPYKY